ncbi:hypothetical protein FA10DRAFT_254704 [Acaromyces ingoldii]|uniref:Cation/H+ exchanger transmembrane domain-containing protein n=1 Tax=Acaromyces ingoldii TaxID=215250 RepID=A0A316YGE4_9BASI|nr:hypothetical protein FA10DRAFT_254704 [Acaromyces ingoldii]PWN88487.1 hypothetical protein FA10DRAFT_254704 [Acaromyces ingoldii]
MAAVEAVSEPPHGWLSHVDPLTYESVNVWDSSNGLALFLAQVMIILALCYILGLAFQRLGQPKVAGELLAGVCLGPTVFGNIPGFTEKIVPSQSLPLLTLTSNIGLVFFILLVGLETDTDLIKKYARQVALIALPGMAVPFAVSVGLAMFVYEHSTAKTVEFTTFMLFVATVMAVTSLSVLSRVLSELRLLNTVLGSVTIAAGALNDLIGYLLLALGSSLGSGGEKINALYQLLVALALALVQWFVVRPIMFRLILRSGFDLYGTGGGGGDKMQQHQRVPEHLLALTLLGALISAWITEACSLHPILGSLLFGIALPHHNFAVRVTESIETLVIGTLLPLYFVTSGLNANFKLLNTGLVWGQIFLIFFVVFISKFASTTLSAKVAGFSWRESSFVAALMQSKSIIELIILNAGLEIGVLNKQVYAMLFITFIFSTLTVRPLATAIYRPLAEEKARQPREEGREVERSNVADDGEGGEKRGALELKDHFAIVAAVTSANPSVQGLMSFIGLVSGGFRSPDESGNTDEAARIAVDFLRLLPTTEHSTANIMRLLFSHDLGQSDEVLAALKTTAALNNVVDSRSLSTGHLRTGSLDVQSAGGNLPQDVISVSNDESMISALRKSLARAEGRLHSSKAADRALRAGGASELGKAMVLVAWESAVVVSHGTSWLQSAAVAAGFVDAGLGAGQEAGYDDEQEATRYARLKTGANSIPRTLMGRLKEQTVGVVVDARLLDAHGGNSGAPVVSLAQRRRVEEDLWRLGGVKLSRGRLRKSRIVVPFFGGKDDRAAVELCERMASRSSRVEAIIVSVASRSDNEEEMQTILAGGHRAIGEERQDDGKNEEENQTTVNLKTIHQAEADHVDARFLFGQWQSDEDDVQGQAHEGNSDKEAEAETKVRQVGNVTSVSLQPPASSTDITDVEAVLSFCLGLLDERCGDMVLVGRGKIGQRPRNFRSKVEAVVQKRSAVLSHDALAELRSVGKTLGAAAEGCLASGIQTCLLVVQAGTTNERNIT